MLQCPQSTNMLGAVFERWDQYEVVDKLKSCFHMKQNQADGAVVETASKMFGWNWKYHDEGDEIFVDTLPEKKNARSVC